MKEVCLNTSLMPAEPKARSFSFAWTTVKTWHCPHCHLMKTKKTKEAFPVISCMAERPYFSLPEVCLHPQYDLNQMKCYPLLWLMLNCQCCVETVMTRNHMIHFLYFPANSVLLLACFTPCKRYWSMLSVIQQHPLFQFLHGICWWAQFSSQNSGQWESPKLSHLLDAEVIYKGEKWGGLLENCHHKFC